MITEAQVEQHRQQAENDLEVKIYIENNLLDFYQLGQQIALQNGSVSKIIEQLQEGYLNVEKTSAPLNEPINFREWLAINIINISMRVSFWIMGETYD